MAGAADASGAGSSFTFEHRVFQAPGAVFRKNRIDGSVALHLTMGGNEASIAMHQLAKNFAIDPDGPDGHMLDLVERALHFVREIRPGDRIPNEMLDGRASWSVERRHYDRARGKVLVQLVTWMTEGTSVIEAGVDVLKLLQTPEVKGKITAAFRAAARQLGIDEADSGAIPAMIADLAGELAHVEALREKAAGYAVIRWKLRELAAAYRNDVRVSEMIERTLVLINQPLAWLRQRLHLVDEQTAEIMSSLRQLAATVNLLRGARDELREFVLLWDDLDVAWLMLPAERSERTDALIARTYRFAAMHYSVTQAWTLGGG